MVAIQQQIQMVIIYTNVSIQHLRIEISAWKHIFHLLVLVDNVVKVVVTSWYWSTELNYVELHSANN